jgi:hypothetical protein
MNDVSASSVGMGRQCHSTKDDPFRVPRNAVWKCDIADVAPTVDLNDELSVARRVVERFHEQARTGDSLFDSENCAVQAEFQTNISGIAIVRSVHVLLT